MSTEELEVEALKLAPQERARLAEKLLESLENLSEDENAESWHCAAEGCAAEGCGHPARYRVAAEDAAHDLRGSVYTYVDVSDFAKAPLSLLGIVFGASAVKTGNVLGDLLPVTPTAQRHFAASRRIAALVRVYDTAAQEQSPVTVAARILDIHSAVTFRRTASLRVGGSPPRSADYLLDLPLSTLPAGDYLLTIEATRGERTVARDIRFGVR